MKPHKYRWWKFGLYKGGGYPSGFASLWITRHIVFSVNLDTYSEPTPNFVQFRFQIWRFIFKYKKDKG